MNMLQFMVIQSLRYTKLLKKVIMIAIPCIAKENLNPLPYIAIPENNINEISLVY